MTIIVEELKAAIPKKELLRSNAMIVRNTALLEALAKGGGYVTSRTSEDGKVKIKILVKKQDLKQIMLDTLDTNNALTNNSKGNSVILTRSSPTSSLFEMRLYELMKKKRASQAKERHPSYWKPALQSIPEEH